MSGSRDTRESTEEVGAAAVPADAVPPSFGGAAPPADPPAEDARPEPAEEAEPAPADHIRLPPFGLQAPWWAAESTETGPPEEDEPSPGPVAGAAASVGDADETTATGADDDADDDADDEAEARTGEETGERPAVAQTDTVPLGTLVAGIGVPNVDSRGAVPATPIVKRPVMSGETDPDGFPAVQPDDGTLKDAPEETAATAENAAEDTESAAESTGPAAEAEERDATGTEAETEPGTEADTVVDLPAATDEGASRTGADADTAVDIPIVEGTARKPSVEDEQTAAFERAKAAEDASSASSAPVLEPDAILPVGVTPPTGSGPYPSTGDAATAPQAAVAAPVGQGGGPSGTPDQAPKAGSGRTKRRLALVGGGAAAVLAAAVALFVIGGDSDAERSGQARPVESPAGARSAPPSAPSSAPPSEAASSGPPSRIDHERTDPRPLAFQDVFPTPVIKMGGRTYTRDRWSLNRDPAYAARGSMLQTLQREKCRKIIRATFIDRKTSLAVTSGIAVMPTKEAALTVSRAGDPANYEWFRGMGGKHTPNLDRAGGYAAATVRGRYVAYAYVQWANGDPARPGDPVIKQAAQRFLDYDLRPIMQRARG